MKQIIMLNKTVKIPRAVILALVISFHIVSAISYSQQQGVELTLDKAILMVLENNPVVKNSALFIKISETEKKEIWQIEPLDINFHYGQDYSTLWDQGFEVRQNFGPVLSPFYKSKLVKTTISMEKVKQNQEVDSLLQDLKLSYFNWQYQYECAALIYSQLSLVNEYTRVISIKYDQGEKDEYERIKAEMYFLNLRNEYFDKLSEIQAAENQLQAILFIGDSLIAPADDFEIYEIDKKNHSFSYDSVTNSYTVMAQSNVEYCKNLLAFQKSQFSPQFYAVWNNHQINHLGGFNSFELGLAIPLWPLCKLAQTQKAKYQLEIANNELLLIQTRQQEEVNNLIVALNNYFQQLQYYKTEVIPKVEILKEIAGKKLDEEEIDFQEYFQSIRETLNIELDYLTLTKKYNDTAVKLEYLTR